MEEVSKPIEEEKVATLYFIRENSKQKRKVRK
jgi:hypothetical protein